MRKKKVKEPQLVYPVNNKVLRFYGDVILLLAHYLTRHGLNYGGVYEYDLED